MLCSVSQAQPQEHLFILSGQSNMAGLDPAISFTPAVEEALGAEHVVVVKDAQGGEPIRKWYKKWRPADGAIPDATGELYDRLMDKVSAASEGRAFKTVSFIWMQGERDARESHGEVYIASLEGLFSQLSQDLGRDDVNFVVGRLSDFDLNNDRYPHWTMVRAAQVEVATSFDRSAWVDTDDLNDGVNKAGKTIENDLHYSVEGYRKLGQRFAGKALDLIKSQKK